MIIGYTYEADSHCEECAVDKFGGELEYAIDREGNQVTPLFDWDSVDDCNCGSCGRVMCYFERGVMHV